MELAPMSGSMIETNIKVILLTAKETEEEFLNGLMGVSIAENFMMVINKVMVFYIVKDPYSMKDNGKLECSMEMEFNILKMAKNTKDHLRTIISMGKGYFKKLVRRSRVYGRIMSL